jgi:hypothetical protein
MLKKDIVVGGLYKAKVSNKIVTVRVDKIRTSYGTGRTRDATVYDVTNLTTKRTTTFRSAAKFRESVQTWTTLVSIKSNRPRFKIGDRIKIGPNTIGYEGHYKAGDEGTIKKIEWDKGGGGHAPGWVCTVDISASAYSKFWEELLEPVMEGEKRTDFPVQNAPSAETTSNRAGVIPATNLPKNKPGTWQLSDDLPGSY